MLQYSNPATAFGKLVDSQSQLFPINCRPVRVCGEIGFNILEILSPSGATIHQHILQVCSKANPASNATSPTLHPAPLTPHPALLTVLEAVLVAALARPCPRRYSRRGGEGTGPRAAG